MSDTPPPARPARFLTPAVVALSLPAVGAALAHGVFGTLEHHPAGLPGFVEACLYWTMVSAGMLSAPCTAGALVGAVVGSFLSGVPRRAKVAMWALVALSLLGFVYLTRSFRP